MTGTSLDFSQRLGGYSGLNPPLKFKALIFPVIALNCLVSLICWPVIVVFLKRWSILMPFVTFYCKQWSISFFKCLIISKVTKKHFTTRWKMRQSATSDNMKRARKLSETLRKSSSLCRPKEATSWTFLCWLIGSLRFEEQPPRQAVQEFFPINKILLGVQPVYAHRYYPHFCWNIDRQSQHENCSKFKPRFTDALSPSK